MIKEKYISSIKVYDHIVDIVLAYYGIDLEKANSRTRKREIAQARQVCFYFGQKETELSLELIGSAFGRTHSTVISGQKTINNLLDVDKSIRHDINFLQQQITK